MGFKCIDLTGQRFGRLIAIKNTKTKNKWNTYIWECKCDCGKTILLDSHKLRSGNTKSCGCLFIDKAKTMSQTHLQKHGKSNTRIYHVYTEIKARCFNQNNNSYKYYGARGITMCDEWRNDFGLFYDWAIKSGYREGLTIDRIDVNGNYCPENCRFVSMQEQQNNKSSNKIYFYNGEKLNETQLCKKYKINLRTFRGRINRGMNLQESLEKPIQKRKREVV